MDFRRTKLFLAFAIILGGMVIALVWHGWQGWCLHRGYPFNTFLYIPSHRFDDLTQIVGYAQLPSPYRSIWGGYMPAGYSFIGCLAWLSPSTGTMLFLSIGALGLWILLMIALYPMIFNPKRFLSSQLCIVWISTGLIWCSYPVLIALDRANVELLMALLIALSLICFQHGKNNLGLCCLFPAICFKAYPCLLASLFLRPGYVYKVLILGVAVVGFNFICFASYAGTMMENWKLWQSNLHFMNDYYIIEDGQLHGSASPWNTGKAVVETWYYLMNDVANGHALVFSKEKVETVYSFYGFLSLVVILGVTAYAILIENEFFRRSILLLILMTLCVPSGGDYRLLYGNIALIVLILLSSRRRNDLAVVGLLALVVVPKKEIYFSYMGLSDCGYSDTPLGIFLNAPCLLVSMTLLIGDSITVCPLRFWRQRLYRMFGPMHRILEGAVHE